MTHGTAKSVISGGENSMQRHVSLGVRKRARRESMIVDAD